ncbi:MAG: HlyC/CorC family transporter, partial [Candidatus Marinimicrobia bacterium]|nr:HlyC/CorC family transporter [Candidatus Neomarinimicrobiota bacterium]
ESVPISFPEIREYDTLGGFLLEQFGDIPLVKSKIDYENYMFEVKSLSDNRIIKVIITKLEGKSEPG